MKNKDIDIYDYNKIIFVDASGDDGFSFNENSGDGSSYTYVVSCLVITPEEFEHNCSVLQNTKNALNLSYETELKSTTLRRHRFANDAFNELSKIQGDVFSFVVFKKDLAKKAMNDDIKEILETKDISGLSHVAPLFALSHTKLIDNDAKVLIVIDHMKKTEQEAIDRWLETFKIENKFNCTLIYRDSKSKKFPLIQLADAIAGTVRNYFESTFNDSKTLRFYCEKCRISNNLCKSGTPAKIRKKYHFLDKYKIILSLHKNRLVNNLIMVVSITTLPLNYHYRYSYIDCILSQINRNRKRN